MPKFEPTLEDSQFLSDLSKHVQSNPSLYQAAGDWLDREFSAEACWQKEIEQAERDNREFPLPPYPKHEPREKRIVELKLNRIIAAANHFLHGDTTLVTTPRWDHASRLLLLCWILTDETAHEFTPTLCDLQQWEWDEDSDQQFSRLWSQAVLPNPADWRKWLDKCRKAWIARPDTDTSDPSKVLRHIADALERFALKVGVCLMPDDPRWSNEPAAKGVLMNLKLWKSNTEERKGLPPHLVAGIALKIKIAHEVDLVLDRLPDLASRFHDDFNELWTAFDHLIDEFKQGRDTYDASLGKMLAVALRVDKLADRARKAARQLQEVTSKTSGKNARNAVYPKQKKTTAEEARRWAETYIKNHQFTSVNDLAERCANALTTDTCKATCSPHTMRKAIDGSESLKKVEAAYKLQKGKPVFKPRSADDPAWNTVVNEAMRTLLACAIKSDRDKMNTDQMLQQLAQMDPDALSVLVKDAEEQAETRRKAAAQALSRAHARTPK